MAKESSASTPDGAGRTLSSRPGIIDLAVALCAVCVLALSVSWAVSSDPALRTLGESSAVRAELMPLRQVPIGEFVYLGAASPNRWILGSGFSPAEEDGAWVRSNMASLVFYPEEVRGDLLVELSVSPLLLAGQSSRTVSFRSPVEVREVALGASGGRVLLRLPDQAEQVVEIICESLDAPVGGEVAIDVRRLCVKVFALAVHPAAEFIASDTEM